MIGLLGSPCRLNDSFQGWTSFRETTDVRFKPHCYCTPDPPSNVSVSGDPCYNGSIYDRHQRKSVILLTRAVTRCKFSRMAILGEIFADSKNVLQKSHSMWHIRYPDERLRIGDILKTRLEARRMDIHRETADALTKGFEYGQRPMQPCSRDECGRL